MKQNPLLTTLLDLDAELTGRVSLIIGGGNGLYLKQLYLQDHPEHRTLFPLSALPAARTTEDIDLILQADVVTDSTTMKSIRHALDRLGFAVVESAKFMQFTRAMEPGVVKIDLLAAPLGQFADRVRKDVRRVKPRPSVDLHASKLEEAVGVEEHATVIPISGTLSTGAHHDTTICVPQAFSYLLMKLTAFRDRLDDADKQLGRHHALDVYRIVGMMTRDEDAHVRALSQRFSDHPCVVEARRIAAAYFDETNGVGRLRIREHPLATAALDLERFATELRAILSGGAQ